METEDLINLPASRNSGGGSVDDDPCETAFVDIEADSLPLISEVKDELIAEDPATIFDGFHENMQTVMTTDIEKDGANNVTSLPLCVELTKSVSVIETTTSIGSSVHTENGSLAVQSTSSLRNHKKDGTHLSRREVDASFFSGVKRTRITSDEQQPSVHVIYNSLTNDSKLKLEELLQQWSRWHAHSSPSSNDSNIVLESGEETYFPALRIGLDKPSTVTFWVDNQIKNQSSKELIPLDGTSVPLYDRGYSLALTSADVPSSLDGKLENLDSSRCFNCGSYSHALKDCRKPRDNAAVNNARKQHKSKRNQHSSSRNSTRYYKSSRGGKYAGLMPGVLDAETRQFLSLGELDPPPWLNRMRELGYPPGYLEPDEDQPSGITIFGEEANEEETEDGEIPDASYTKPSWKMSIAFPGINAPIPENADERLWAATSSSSFNLSKDRSLHRYNHSSEDLSREHYHKRRRSRDFEDDGPPGCEPGTSPSLSNHFRRYGGYDSSYSPLSSLVSPSMPWSPTFGRSLSDRGRRGPLVQDGSPNHGHYGSFPYSSPR